LASGGGGNVRKVTVAAWTGARALLGPWLVVALVAAAYGLSMRIVDYDRSRT
jgi:hypothetical protein